ACQPNDVFRVAWVRPKGARITVEKERPNPINRRELTPRARIPLVVTGDGSKDFSVVIDVGRLNLTVSQAKPGIGGCRKPRHIKRNAGAIGGNASDDIFRIECSGLGS